LNDPLQATIEAAIHRHVPSYDYGSRRSDQTECIANSGLFSTIHAFEFRIVHQQSTDDCIDAWRSHGTLHRQAGHRFPRVIDAIRELLSETGSTQIAVPYATRVWLAPRI